jgi:hypothetical protein
VGAERRINAMKYEKSELFFSVSPFFALSDILCH